MMASIMLFQYKSLQILHHRLLWPCLAVHYAMHNGGSDGDIRILHRAFFVPTSVLTSQNKRHLGTGEQHNDIPDLNSSHCNAQMSGLRREGDNVCHHGTASGVVSEGSKTPLIGTCGFAMPP